MNRLILLACLLSCLTLQPSLAATLTATVDRTQINSNETLALTVQYDEDTGEEPDTRALEQHFSIVSKNTASSIRIINGDASATTTWYYELMPRKSGTLLVPSFSIDGNFSEAITIEVKEGPRTAAQQQENIYTETVLDQQQVTVQQQVIVTWRMVSALNISEPKFLPPQIDGALVQDLGNRFYHRAGADGQVERVFEQRYALFPQHSGELTIPAQLFQVLVTTTRRSSWGIVHTGGTRVRVSSDPQTLTVTPADSSRKDPWLPASKVEISQEFGGLQDGQRVTAGTAFTRTVQLRAEGLSAEQLPAPSLDANAVKVYPETPVFRNLTDESGITGIREDQAALIATRPGPLTLPAIRVAWYDITSARWQEAVLPETRLEVLPGDGQPAPTAIQDPDPASATNRQADGSASPANASESTPPAARTWQLVAGIALLLWLLTAGWLWHVKRKPGTPQATGIPADAIATLTHAIHQRDWAAAHRALMAWSAEQQNPALLAQMQPTPAVQALEQYLFNRGPAPDPGLMASLPAALSAVAKPSGNTGSQTQLAELYPSGKPS